MPAHRETSRRHSFFFEEEVDWDENIMAMQKSKCVCVCGGWWIDGWNRWISWWYPFFHINSLFGRTYQPCALNLNFLSDDNFCLVLVVAANKNLIVHWNVWYGHDSWSKMASYQRQHQKINLFHVKHSTLK